MAFMAVIMGLGILHYFTYWWGLGIGFWVKVQKPRAQDLGTQVHGFGFRI